MSSFQPKHTAIVLSSLGKLNLYSEEVCARVRGCVLVICLLSVFVCVCACVCACVCVCVLLASCCCSLCTMMGLCCCRAWIAYCVNGCVCAARVVLPQLVHDDGHTLLRDMAC